MLFVGGAPVRRTMEDVDGDGEMDLLFHFKTEELNLEANSTEAILTGDTTDGKHVKGTDEANIVPRASNTASPALPTRAAPDNPHYYTAPTAGCAK